MTPNPNPSPELIEEARTAAFHAIHGPDADLFENPEGYAFSSGVADAVLAALSPQTLPAPGEVDYAEAARVMYEACSNRFMRAEQCYPAIDALAAAGFFAPSVEPNAPSSPALATVAAANDEAWPSDALHEFGAWVQKKGRASWRGRIVGWYRTDITALGYAVESAYEPGSVQIYPETALLPLNPAIRLLSQGGGK
jgi:hypothetical protein